MEGSSEVKMMRCNNGTVCHGQGLGEKAGGCERCVCQCASVPLWCGCVRCEWDRVVVCAVCCRRALVMSKTLDCTSLGVCDM